MKHERVTQYWVDNVRVVKATTTSPASDGSLAFAGVIDAASESEVAMAFDPARIVAILLTSTEDVAVHANFPSFGASDSVSVPSDRPVIWMQGDPQPCPFVDIVDTLWIANDTATDATVLITVLLDVTPGVLSGNTVGIGATEFAADSGGTGSFTFQVTPTNGNTYAVVKVASPAGAANAATGVTIGGVAMTLLGAYAGSDMQVSYWGKAGVPVDAPLDVVVTWATVDGYGVAAVTAYYDVGVVGPFHAVVGADTAPRITIPSATNEVVDAMATTGSPLTIALGTERWNDPAGMAAGGTRAGQTFTDMIWSWGSNSTWLAAGVALRPV